MFCLNYPHDEVRSHQVRHYHAPVKWDVLIPLKTMITKNKNSYRHF